MKELYVVEQLMTMGSKFYVYDKKGYKKYSVNGDRDALGKGVVIYNSNRSEKLLTIKKDTSIEKFAYNLYGKGNNLVARVEKIPIKYSYKISGELGEYEVNSINIYERTYLIKNKEDEIGKITKKMTLKNDSYILEYTNVGEEVLLISIIIIIDMIRFHTE